MTVESEKNRMDLVACSSEVTSFVFDFKILTQEDIKVVWFDTDGVAEIFELTTDYTVTGLDGGTVDLVVAKDDGQLLIMRAPDFTQLLDLISAGLFDPELMEKGLDSTVMLLLYLLDRVDRSLTLPDYSTTKDINMPEPTAASAGQTIRINDEGDDYTYGPVVTEYQAIQVLDTPPVAPATGTIWIKDY